MSLERLAGVFGVSTPQPLVRAACDSPLETSRIPESRPLTVCALSVPGCFHFLRGMEILLDLIIVFSAAIDRFGISRRIRDPLPCLVQMLCVPQAFFPWMS